MNNNKAGMGKAIVVIIIVVIGIIVLGMSLCDNGHAPGYGETNKCTICGKPATHSSHGYGYCDKHWAKAQSYENR